jgi:hypothetical protein
MPRNKPSSRQHVRSECCARGSHEVGPTKQPGGSKVLYSGTHSGNTIAGESIHELAAELESIRKTEPLSPEFELFLAALEDLINVAKHEGNPIVFV